MTTTTAATTLSLTARRSGLYDERAAEYSRRQAVLDVAQEDGRDPDSQLNADEQRMFDDHSSSIRRLDAQIDALTHRIAAREHADLLIEAADAKYR